MTQKTDKQWREQLSDEQYRITRKAGTEAAFSGTYYKHNATGIYHCLCCQQPLFSSADKFDSGCGWPSFSAHLESDAITQHRDVTHGMIRTELRCSQCESHLGHMFGDGPTEAGISYCINSVSLNFSDD